MIAGITLRRQAALRTAQEVENPSEVWGIKGTNISARCGGISTSWIRRHAVRRLRMLEGMS